MLRRLVRVMSCSGFVAWVRPRSCWKCGEQEAGGRTGSSAWVVAIEVHRVTTGWDLFGRVCLGADRRLHEAQRAVLIYLPSGCLRERPIAVGTTFVEGMGETPFDRQRLPLNQSELA